MLEDTQVKISVERKYLEIQRDAYLQLVDALERVLCISPRTSELRKYFKGEKFGVELRKENKDEL